MSSMKFLMFSDLHYNPGWLPGASWDTLKTFQKRAEEDGCDFIIHAGDFCHKANQITDFLKAYDPGLRRSPLFG